MSIKDKDDIIFGDKSLSSLLEDIYSNSKKKDATIDDIMKSFLMSLKGGKDIAYIGPVIKDLLDVGVKNDDQIVKIATIVQRIMTNGGSSEEDSLGLSDKMKEELLATIQEAEETDNNLTKQIEDISVDELREEDAQ
jgi:hypothetical protein